jgi:hypothetical protein
MPTPSIARHTSRNVKFGANADASAPIASTSTS